MSFKTQTELIAASTGLFYDNNVGAITPFTWTISDRERVLDLFEALCGARLLYNYIWPGGVSHDLPPKFIDRTIEFLDYFDKKYDDNAKICHDKNDTEETDNDTCTNMVYGDDV